MPDTQEAGARRLTTTTATRVPFVDLGRHHAARADDLRAAFERVLESGGFILGAEVEDFEAAFAELCGVRHCVGVGSGTAALTLALVAAGIGPGDEVIVPAHTYIATAIAVASTGAEPVFCDVDEGSGLIDLGSAAVVVSARTAAIVPVHLYGQVCDMDAVGGFAERHGLLVLEDAAQAHGARFGGRPAGSFGGVAGFSFYPSKNLGALGDGGAICTDSDEIAIAARRLRNLGQEGKGEHLQLGFNDRLDGLQAAFLQVELERLEESNAARRASAAAYREVLPPDCRVLEEHPAGECVFHLFPVRVARRDEVRDQLAARGIATGVHYPLSVPEQPPFAGCRRTETQRAGDWCREEISLPMFPELTGDQVDAVAEALADSLEATR
jgi:dTDP-4-amino-4,6-dideoxygalactose transaminase